MELCVAFRLLSITGRIKELIITAGGENIAPVPCEDSVKLHANGVISNVVMIGDKRKFNTCLITLKQKVDPDANGGQGGFFEDLDGAAAALSPACTTAAQAAVDMTWIAHLRKAISTYNTQVRCSCRW
jgi:long-chain-fatty-acid--CoA ligase ACSBG